MTSERALAWSDNLRDVRGRIRQTSMHILSWGPGRGTRYFNIRQRIVAGLEANNNLDNVAMSEGFPDVPELATEGVKEREYVQAEAAKVIFVLLTQFPRAFGAELEVIEFGQDHDLRAKMRILIPIGHEKNCTDLIGVQLLDVLRRFPSMQKFEYLPPASRRVDDLVQWCTREIETHRVRYFRLKSQV